jgi:small subunit ribosomal protein S15
MICQKQKAEVVQKFGKNAKDSGSTEVQVAIITTRINDLAGHFQNHKHDYHSKRGLMMLIGKRRRLLKYLKSSNEERYNKVIAELGLRK